MDAGNVHCMVPKGPIEEKPTTSVVGFFVAGAVGFPNWKSKSLTKYQTLTVST
jgi:hypothetical protein